MKIAVVGLGHMGKALAKGFANVREISVYNRRKIKFGGENIKVYDDLKKIVEENDVIVLATPHTTYSEILETVEEVKTDKIFISVAPQIGSNELKKLHDKFMILIPNTPVAINDGVMGATNVNLSEEEYREVIKNFESLGKVYDLKEEDTMLLSVVAGCLPAYFYIFMEAAADGAVLRGMERNLATDMITRTVKGCCDVILEDVEELGKLKGKSTTPGGLTIKGVHALERGGFRNAIIDAINESR